MISTALAGTWSQGPEDFPSGSLENGAFADELGFEIERTAEWGTTSVVPSDLNNGLSLIRGGEYLYLLDGDSGFWKYDPTSMAWTQLADFPVDATYGAAMAWAGDSIYAVDGNAGGFWRYDISNNEWEPRADVPEEVNSGGALAWDENNHIYVLVGGSDSSAYKYSIADNTWSSAPNPAGTIGVGGSLLFVDGWLYYLKGGDSSSFWRLNVSTGVFEQLRSLPYSVKAGGSLAYGGDGYIYTICGEGEPNAFLRYLIRYDYWEELDRVPVSLSDYHVGSHLASDGEYVYLVYEGSPPQLLRYGLREQAWDYTPPMPHTYFYGSTVVGTDEKVYGLLHWNEGHESDSSFWDFYAGGLRENIAISKTQGNLFLSYEWWTRAAPSSPVVRLVWTGGDNIYGDNTTHLWRYTISSDTWTATNLAPLPVTMPSGYHNLVWDGGDYIYAIRGTVNNDNLYRYSIADNLWTTLASGHGTYIVALEMGTGSQVYGWGSNGNLYEYDGTAWSVKYAGFIEPLVRKCDMLRIDSENIYLLRGGYDLAFYRWNIVDNTITSLPTPPVSASEGASLVNLSDDIYLTIGNHTTANYRNSLWHFSIADNAWDVVYTMPGDITGGSAMASNGNYIFATQGGGTTAFWRIDPRQYAPSGAFISDDHDAGRLPVVYEHISWSATAPSATALRFQFGTAGQTGTYFGPDGSQSSYYETSGTEIWSGHTDNATFYYKAFLSTTDTGVTPTVEYVTVSWRPAGGLYEYTPGANAWTLLTPAPDNIKIKNGVAMAYDGRDYLYLLGGGAYGENRRYFWKYRISDNTWIRLADTLFRQGAGASLVWVRGDGAEEYIYAFMGGAEHHSDAGKKFLRYSISNNFWSEAAEVPDGVDDGGSLEWVGGDYIYAFEGAYAGTNTSKAFLRYSIGGNTWEYLENLPEYIDDGGSLVWDGGNYLYALSGSNTEGADPVPARDFWRYNLTTGRWENAGLIPAGVGYYTANRFARVGENLYVYRGYGTRDFWRYVVRFKPSATYTSAVKDAGAVALWENVVWSARIPGGIVEVFVSLSNDGASWTDWISVSNNSAINRTSKYLKYKVVSTSSPDGRCSPLFERIQFSYSAITAAVPTLLNPPDGAKLSDPTPYLAWAPAAYAPSYELQYSQDPEFAAGVTYSELENTFYQFATQLAEGVWYWRVRAVDPNGDYGDWSDASAFAVDATAPPTSTPSSPDGIVLCIRAVPLAWEPVNDASGVTYTVQLSTDNAFSFSIVENTTGLTSLTVAVPADNTYFWRVRATDGAGNRGAWSASGSFVVVTQPPPMVTPENAAVLENEVVLSWVAAEGMPAYKVQLATSQDFSTVVLETEVTDNRFEPEGLGPGLYYWRVAAKDAAGNLGTWSSPRSLRVHAAETELPPPQGVDPWLALALGTAAALAAGAFGFVVGRRVSSIVSTKGKSQNPRN